VQGVYGTLILSRVISHRHLRWTSSQHLLTILVANRVQFTNFSVIRQAIHPFAAPGVTASAASGNHYPIVNVPMGASCAWCCLVLTEVNDVCHVAVEGPHAWTQGELCYDCHRQLHMRSSPGTYGARDSYQERADMRRMLRRLARTRKGR
jgi:hypothetical protein